MENQTDNQEPQQQAQEQPNLPTTTPTFWERNKLMLKGCTIAFLILMLLIPQFFIGSLIHERANRQQDVITEVSNKWASSQTITGPMIVLPYLQKYKTTDGKITTQKAFAYLLPETLNIDGNILPEERKRSIFKVMLYRSNLKCAGTFNNIALDKLQLNPSDILWNESKLCIGISDNRGIEEQIAINWDGQEKYFSAGMEDKNILHNALCIPLNISANDINKAHTFAYNLKLKGSQKIFFTPVGKTTAVQIQSSWQNPDFQGKFTANSKINNKGFTANWNVVDLNRDMPQQWKDEKYNIDDEAFGVNLLQPIDTYGKTTRAVKYAMLVVLLTFTIYFFIEILQKKWIHPIQYTLIGFALCLFYTLLLSIGEYTGFNAAYIIAALATIGLIACYTLSLFKGWKITSIFTSFLGTIYLFVYMLIQLDESALLVGSIGLFIILASIMYVSRKIDWQNSKR